MQHDQHVILFGYGSFVLHVCMVQWTIHENSRCFHWVLRRISEKAANIAGTQDRHRLDIDASSCHGVAILSNSSMFQPEFHGIVSLVIGYMMLYY